MAAGGTVGSRGRVYKSHFHIEQWSKPTCSITPPCTRGPVCLSEFPRCAPASVLEAPGHVFSAHGVAWQSWPGSAKKESKIILPRVSSRTLLSRPVSCQPPKVLILGFHWLVLASGCVATCSAQYSGISLEVIPFVRSCINIAGNGQRTEGTTNKTLKKMGSKRQTCCFALLTTTQKEGFSDK